MKTLSILSSALFLKKLRSIFKRSSKLGNNSLGFDFLALVLTLLLKSLSMIAFLSKATSVIVILLTDFLGSTKNPSLRSSNLSPLTISS